MSDQVVSPPHWSSLDGAELEHEISAVMQRAEASPVGYVSFPSDDPNCRLRLQYLDSGEVLVLAGSAFDEREWQQVVDRVERDLIVSTESIARRICFSAYPVTGSWRNEAWPFQMLPPPPGAPLPPVLMADHPFLLKQADFDRATYWFTTGQEIGHTSRSASWIALVSAIESLVPVPSGGERCPSCGKSSEPGPTQRFREFLGTYGPTSHEYEIPYAKLYGVRSALQHGGKLLLMDEQFRWSLDPAFVSEDEQLTLLHVAVATALRNWLIAASTDI